MKPAGAADASARTPMARRIAARAGGAGAGGAGAGGASLPVAARRLLAGFGIAALALVAGIGAFSGQAAGRSAPGAPAPTGVVAVASNASLSGSWGGGGVGQIDPFDLLWKGVLVLALLFVTLRVLGRLQGANPGRRGNLTVLESRSLASKASLHLVAVGDRRLVVGLTPSGMVALAELDADELPEQVVATPFGQSPAASPETGPAEAGTPRPAAARAGSPQAFDAVLRPIDSFAARLAAAVRKEQAR